MSPHDPHGIEGEPHLNPRDPKADAESDPSEARADRALRRARPRDAEGHPACDACGHSRRTIAADAPCTECGAIPEELARHSVFNEPGAIFPVGTAAHRIGTAERDWSCDHCGYNVRGLPMGATCPECGETSLSRPAPLDRASYATWLKHRLSQRRTAGEKAIVPVIALLSGVWALLGSFLLQAVQASGQVFTVCVWAPVIEEIMKIALLAIVVERWPDRFRSVRAIFVTAVASALIFASVENLLYLTVYTTAPSNTLIIWRLVVCTALHVGATLVAVSGVAAMWQRATSELREPDAAPIYRSLTLAIVIHAAYNTAMVAFHFAGYTF